MGLEGSVCIGTLKASLVIYTCNVSAFLAEAGGSGLGGETGLHSETLSQTIIMDF